MRNTRYYLAYGSNLNVEQMAWRCPHAKVVGTATIVGYELLFKGSGTGAYLTIERKKGGIVPVAVWETTAADELALDRYEGYPRFYYKAEMELPVTLKDGGHHTCNCYVYIMHEDRKLGLPSPSYVETCLVGYRSFDFEEGLLFDAIDRSRAEITSMGGRVKICPKCGGAYHEEPAISRIDNATKICPGCGEREALECYIEALRKA